MTGGGGPSPVIFELKGKIDHLQAQLGKAQADIEKVAKAGGDTTAKELAKGKVAWEGIAAAALGAGAYVVKSALDGQRVTAQLRNAVQNTGGSFTEAQPKVNALSNSFVKFGYENDQVEQALAMLTRSTGSVSKAMVDMQLAADLAAGAHMSLEEAAVLLAHVMAGNTRGLKQLGLSTETAGGQAMTASQAFQMLRERFGGAAQADADTYAGKLAAFGAASKNAAESLGNLLLPKMAAAATAGAATAQWLGKNQLAAVALAGVLGGPLAINAGKWVASLAAAKLSSIANGLQAVGAAANGLSAAEAAAATSGEAMSLGLSGLLRVGPAAIAAGAGLFILKGRMDAAGAAAQASLAKIDQAAAGSADKHIELLKKRIDELNKKVSESGPHFTAFGTVIAPFSTDINKTATELNRAKAELAGLQRTASSPALDDFGNQLDEDAQKAEELADKLDKLRGLVEKEIDAQRAVSDVLQRQADDTAELASKKQALNALVRRGKVDLDALASATRASADADRAAAQAKQGVTDAQKALDEALHPTARTQSEAEVAVREANRALEEARKRVIDLNSAYAQGRVTDFVQQNIDVAAAQDEVTRATFGQQDAQSALDAILHPETTDAVTRARADLAAATDNAKRADDDARDAAKKLADTRAGDPEFESKVAAAREAVASQTRQLAADSGAVGKAEWDAKVAIDAATEALQKNKDLAYQTRMEYEDFVKAHPEAAAYLNPQIALLPNGWAGAGWNGKTKGSGAPVAGAGGTISGSGSIGGGNVIVNGDVYGYDEFAAKVRDANLHNGRRYGAAVV